MAYAPPGGYAPPGAIIPVPVNSSYCVPYVMQFVTGWTKKKLHSKIFNIYDSRGQLLFDVTGTGSMLGMATKRTLRDQSGGTILLMKEQLLTLHNRWVAYRGSVDHDNNAAYTLKKMNSQGSVSSFAIFLSNNSSKIPDFHVQGNIKQHSYSILYGHSRVAEVSKIPTAPSADQYSVTINPGTDLAFVASVVYILDSIARDDGGGDADGGDGGDDGGDGGGGHHGDHGHHGHHGHHGDGGGGHHGGNGGGGHHGGFFGGGHGHGDGGGGYGGGDGGGGGGGGGGCGGGGGG